MAIYTFIETLKRLIADPAVATKNALFDPAMTTLFTSRVSNLTPDVVTWLTGRDVMTTEGSLDVNVGSGAIALATDDFQMTFSKFRDGLAALPQKIRRRVPTDIPTATPADRVQYIVSDLTNGVLLLDTNLEVVRTFPGLTSTVPLSGATYAGATCAMAATISSTELMFVACSSHCVKIFNYATGALVSTIGVSGTSGVPTDSPPKLDLPSALAVDMVGKRLFIACAAGNPVGADSTDAGFVSEWDITTPGTPTFINVFLKGTGLYRLNNMECQKPCDLFLQPAVVSPSAQDARLWVANGLGDVAAFTRTAIGNPWVATLVIPAQGRDYVLGPDLVADATPANNAIDVFTPADEGGDTKLLVAANLVGKVEMFRAATTSAGTLGRHVSSFGKHAQEDQLPFSTTLRLYSTPPDPALTFGVLSEPTGVVLDEQILDGETDPIVYLLINDASAGRLQRIPFNIYDNDNIATYNPSKSDVPVFVLGWFLPAAASMPPDFITVEVRDPGDNTVSPPISSGPWVTVPQAGFPAIAQGPVYTRLQFRVSVTQPPDATVQAYSFPALGLLLRQEW